MRMEVNGIEGDLFDEFGKFFLVICLLPQAFLHLAAPDEGKCGIGDVMCDLLGHVR